MIATEKLIEFLHNCPFGKREKTQLIELARFAGEADKKKIFFLAQSFAKQFAQEQAQQLAHMRNAAGKIKKGFRLKSEGIIAKAEDSQLREFESQLTGK